ncbi:dihydroxyacetone kinase subunit DhaL [Isoptericola variabilis]|uniref:Dihydroxyacetone kinase, L subunit n=1 Tax=Isoptericola variabilis (strain 225) TaxID=743718 RepID=F6FRU1_ISOV2|nr:dihydroxyacetone kinase subunit DhaL [Isoptericola variabilis]AEG43942.1 dihydroxyacetone kinase, L subunit [Isoptericola variabilis 225]TWH30535.1 dihydroxyacetone kinase-like protein [Isoptericola variabilis J7]
MTLDVAWSERWVRRSAEALAAARDELTELDRQIGDGDHGENMHRGFRAVVAKLDDGAERTQVGQVLKVVATTLMSSVGGASGPLYGTAFLRAGKVTERDALDAHGVVVMLEAALEGITTRGKATTGEKTMVDAWQPAVDAATRAAQDGADPVAVLRAAAEAADAGATSTIPLVATKGRASYLGPRSAGHEDPGARSTALLLGAALAAALTDEVPAA